jgi:ABC-2 type transport system permease protein
MFKRVLSKQNRALLNELVRTDFKLRYQGSALGYAWSLLRPLLVFLILYIVFVKFLKLGAGVPHYPVYLLLGIVLWNFFLEMTTQSLTSIVGRGDLIRKIRIPRWIIVVSSSFSVLINFLLNLLVVAVFIIFSHVGILSTIIWFPFLVFEIYIFSLGLSFLLAALYVKFRDISYIWEVCLQAGFYITPILYALSRIPNHMYQKIILLNPMAQSIQDARYSIITHDTITGYKVFQHGWHELIPFIIVVFAFAVSVVYFRKESKFFAENI